MITTDIFIPQTLIFTYVLLVNRTMSDNIEKLVRTFFLQATPTMVGWSFQEENQLLKTCGNPFDIPYYVELGLDCSEVVADCWRFAEIIYDNTVHQSVPIKNYTWAKSQLLKCSYRLRVIRGQLMNEIREFSMEPPKEHLKIMGYDYKQAKHNWCRYVMQV
jgi:hypothetical protein